MNGDPSAFTLAAFQASPNHSSNYLPRTGLKANEAKRQIPIGDRASLHWTMRTRTVSACICICAYLPLPHTSDETFVIRHSNSPRRPSARSLVRRLLKCSAQPAAKPSTHRAVPFVVGCASDCVGRSLRLPTAERSTENNGDTDTATAATATATTDSDSDVRYSHYSALGKLVLYRVPIPIRFCNSCMYLSRMWSFQEHCASAVAWLPGTLPMFVFICSTCPSVASPSPLGVDATNDII